MLEDSTSPLMQQLGEDPVLQRRLQRSSTGATRRGVRQQAHREVHGEPGTVAASEMGAISVTVGDRHGSDIPDREHGKGILVGRS
jgi:hypothetical protein